MLSHLFGLLKYWDGGGGGSTHIPCLAAAAAVHGFLVGASDPACASS